MWIARPERRAGQCTWDGESVIYDAVSGNTHYLEPVSATILRHLSAKPASAASICRSLRSEFDADSEADFLAAVQEVLAKLRQMDLIQPAAA